MKDINVIIVDDERLARKELIFLLKDKPAIKVIGEADNIQNSIELIWAKTPDLVFLDIQLTGETGFDLLQKIEVNFKVIFVTAYNESAIKAFDVNASDYLLKPVDPARLDLSLERIFSNSVNTQLRAKKFDYADSIYVELNNFSARFIEINSIIAISSVGNHTKIEISDGSNFSIFKTMKRWEEELPPDFFIRIHRSTIVNLKFIEKLETYSNTCHQVYMKNIASPFEASRNCIKNLEKANR